MSRENRPGLARIIHQPEKLTTSGTIVICMDSSKSLFRADEAPNTNGSGRFGIASIARMGASGRTTISPPSGAYLNVLAGAPQCSD
jgi:hypothetical protein